MPVKSAYTHRNIQYPFIHVYIHTLQTSTYTYIKRYLKENANTNVYPIMKKKNYCTLQDAI